MQTDFGFVHEQNVVLIVLYEHCQQYHEHLLLTARQLIRHQSLTDLREAYLVFGAYNLLSRLRKQVVYDVLKAFLGQREVVSFGRSVGFSALKTAYYPVAHVYLVVQVLAFQQMKLEI